MFLKEAGEAFEVVLDRLCKSSLYGGGCGVFHGLDIVRHVSVFHDAYAEGDEVPLARVVSVCAPLPLQLQVCVCVCVCAAILPCLFW